MAQDTTRRWARPLAVVVAVVAGVVAAVVLWLAAGRRYDDAVADLAPAPVGCDTTLQFDRTGNYTFFLETVGEIGDIDGDCDRDGRSYELDDEVLPRVQLTLVDAGGEPLDLDRATGPSYDRGGSRGGGFRMVDIDEAGEYVLTVESGNDEVVVRVGQDPGRGVTALRIGAGLALLAGLGLGALGLALGRSRPAPPAATPPPDQWPALPVPRPVAPPTAPLPTPPYGTTPAITPVGRPLPPPPVPETVPARGGPLPPPRPPGRRP